MSEEKIRLDTKALDLESLDVEELEQVAGGAEATNNNCYSCTCPRPPAEPILIAAEA